MYVYSAVKEKAVRLMRKHAARVVSEYDPTIEDSYRMSDEFFKFTSPNAEEAEMSVAQTQVAVGGDTSVSGSVDTSVGMLPLALVLSLAS